MGCMRVEDMITVIIPTNRYECIKEIITESISKYNGTLFKFEVHDSSCNEKIKELVRNVGSRLIKYYKYPVEISADNKAMQAIKNVDTEYFWLMGDGIIVDFNGIESVLESISTYKVIDIESVNRIGYLDQDKKCVPERIYEYHDVRLYAKKYFSHITYWGASIIRSDFYSSAYNDILKKYIEEQIPWWIACSLFDLLADFFQKYGDVKTGVVYTEYIKSNHAKIDHWWTGDERYYQYTFKKFNQGISLMSPFYSMDDKKKIIKNFRNDALVSDYYLIHLRAIDNLNKQMLHKYRKDIDIVSGFYKKMYFYHCMPRLVAGYIDRFIVLVKPMYFKGRRFILGINKKNNYLVK